MSEEKEKIIDAALIYYSEDYCDYLVGFEGCSYIGNKITIDYNDKTRETLRIENLTTQVLDNPLTGFKEITIKLQLANPEGSE